MGTIRAVSLNKACSTILGDDLLHGRKEEAGLSFSENTVSVIRNYILRDSQKT